MERFRLDVGSATVNGETYEWGPFGYSKPRGTRQGGSTGGTTPPTPRAPRAPAAPRAPKAPSTPRAQRVPGMPDIDAILERAFDRWPFK